MARHGHANPLDVDRMEVWQVAAALGIDGADNDMAPPTVAERVRRAEAGEPMPTPAADIIDPELADRMRAEIRARREVVRG